MKSIIAQSGQTLFDIALQAMGDVSGVFDILAVNAFLRLDMAIPEGTVVFVPDMVINAQVVDYYERNGIVPVSGLGEEVTLNSEDMINIKQDLNYSVSGGNKIFDPVRLWNLKNYLTVQVNYSNLQGTPVDSGDGAHIQLDQSLDGVIFSPIAGASVTLDVSLSSCTFNLTDLQTNFVRARLTLDIQMTGKIDEIIYRV